MAPFANSPLMYSSEQRQSFSSYDRPMSSQTPLSHTRGSFDAMQPSKTLEDSIGNMPNTPLLESYASSSKQNDNGSSSSYQPTFNGSQFQRPENADGRATFGVEDSRIYFDGSDIQQSTMPSSVQTRQLPFENHRPPPSFGTEHSQTQTQSSNFNGRSVDEASPSSTLVGSSSSANGPSRGTPPFVTSHTELSPTSVSGPGFYGTMTPASTGYEPSSLQQLRMRAGDNPPGTPIYEKPLPNAGVYDKSLPPPSMLPNGHSMSLQPSSMLSSTFGDQTSQGMTMAGAVGPSISSQPSQQAWSPSRNTSEQPHTSAMHNSQSFWGSDVKYFS